MEQCKCAERPPTYPTYRDTIHLPDCPWYQVEILNKRVEAIQKVSDKRYALLVDAIDRADKAEATSYLRFIPKGEKCGGCRFAECYESMKSPTGWKAKCHAINDIWWADADDGLVKHPNCPKGFEGAK